MARVTIEDCIEKVDNPFDLVLFSAQRVREISSGLPVLVDRDNDKNTVVSLREIGEGILPVSQLEETLIKSLRKNSFENHEESHLELETLSEEKDWLQGEGGANLQEELQEDELSLVEEVDGEIEPVDESSDEVAE